MSMQPEPRSSLSAPLFPQKRLQARCYQRTWLTKLALLSFLPPQAAAVQTSPSISSQNHPCPGAELSKGDCHPLVGTTLRKGLPSEELLSSGLSIREADEVLCPMYCGA